MLTKFSTEKVAVFAKRFNRTMRNFLKKLVFENGKASWVDDLPSVIKKCNNIIRNSTKKSPIETSKKSNEKRV